MTQHDKHQYYFEKYLRNDMPEEEREVFEQKLAADASLRMAFEYYKLNRQKLLEQLIEEHQLSRRDNRLNKLIFLLISLTGIVLVLSHFLNKNEIKGDKGSEKDQNIFVRYIPFLNWENRSEKKAEEPPHQNRPAVHSKEKDDSIETLEPSLDRNDRLSADEFKGDTFVTIWEKNNFDKWMVYKKQNDTLAMDSLFKKINPNQTREKTKKLLVEFWESPVSYKGYLFNENKLVLYGLPYPANIYIYKDQDSAVVVLPNGRFTLIDQPKFIRF